MEGDRQVCVVCSLQSSGMRGLRQTDRQSRRSTVRHTSRRPGCQTREGSDVNAGRQEVGSNQALGQVVKQVDGAGFPASQRSGQHRLRRGEYKQHWLLQAYKHRQHGRLATLHWPAFLDEPQRMDGSFNNGSFFLERVNGSGGGGRGGVQYGCQKNNLEHWGLGTARFVLAGDTGALMKLQWTSHGKL